MVLEKVSDVVIWMLVSSAILLTISVTASNSNFLSDNIIYVGGSGPGNYSSIQDAIDDSIDGDTIFVYNGVYYEHIVIDKTIDLTGESKENTIIDGDENILGVNLVNVVEILADNVSFSGFTVRDGGAFYGGDCAGIFVNGDNNIIRNNIIMNNSFISLYLYYSDNNEIKSNNFVDNYGEITSGVVGYNIELIKSNNNIIRDNNFENDQIKDAFFAGSFSNR